MDPRANNIIDNTFSHEGGYQNIPEDYGNYCIDWSKGSNFDTSKVTRAGTKYGITARTLFSKGYISKAECKPSFMKSLSYEKAKEYAYEIFYLPYHVDKVKNDKVAKQYFDFIYMGPGNAVDVLRNAFPDVAFSKSNFRGIANTLNNLVDSRGANYVNNKMAEARVEWFQNRPQASQFPGWIDRAAAFLEGGGGGTLRGSLVRGLLFLGVAAFIYYKVED
jgi:lysozyme family protein